jgi:hypothetical protein
MSVTNKSEMDDDDDKVLFPKIGKTEITIDKVLSNLLVDEVFISHSLFKIVIFYCKKHYSLRRRWR